MNEWVEAMKGLEFYVNNKDYFSNGMDALNELNIDEKEKENIYPGVLHLPVQLTGYAGRKIVESSIDASELKSFLSNFRHTPFFRKNKTDCIINLSDKQIEIYSILGKIKREKKINRKKIMKEDIDQIFNIYLR